MTDMNELLGPQGWGQYFCEPSLAWYDQVHGDTELPYYVGLNSIKTHPDVPEDERTFWVKTVKLLQSNLQAIKYNDRYVVDGYKISSLRTDDYFPEFADYDEAVSMINRLLKKFYSVENYLECSQIIETDEGTIFEPLDLINIPENIMIRVHCKSGKTAVIQSNGLEDYINQEIRDQTQSNSLPYNLWKKIRDIDDGFTVFEQIEI